MKGVFILLVCCGSSLRFNEVPSNDVHMEGSVAVGPSLVSDLNTGRRRRRKNDDDSGGLINSGNVGLVMTFSDFVGGAISVSKSPTVAASFLKKVVSALTTPVHNALVSALNSGETLLTVAARLTTDVTLKYAYGRGFVYFPESGWKLAAGKGKSGSDWDAVFKTTTFHTEAATALKTITGAEIEAYCCAGISAVISKAGSTFKLEGSMQIHVNRIDPVQLDLTAPGEKGRLVKEQIGFQGNAKDNTFAQIMSARIKNGLVKGFALDARYISVTQVVNLRGYVAITMAFRYLASLGKATLDKHNTNPEHQAIALRLFIAKPFIAKLTTAASKALDIPEQGVIQYNPVGVGKADDARTPGIVVTLGAEGAAGDAAFCGEAGVGAGKAITANDLLLFKVTVTVIMPGTNLNSASGTQFETLVRTMGGDNADKAILRGKIRDKIGEGIGSTYALTKADCLGMTKAGDATALTCEKEIYTFFKGSPGAPYWPTNALDTKKENYPWTVADSGLIFPATNAATLNGDLIRVLYAVVINDNEVADAEDKMELALKASQRSDTKFAPAVIAGMMEGDELTPFGLSISNLKSEGKAVTHIQDTDQIV